MHVTEGYLRVYAQDDVTKHSLTATAIDLATGVKDQRIIIVIRKKEVIATNEKEEAGFCRDNPKIALVQTSDAFSHMSNSVYKVVAVVNFHSWCNTHKSRSVPQALWIETKVAW